MKKLLFIPLVFLLDGCIDTEKKVNLSQQETIILESNSSNSTSLDTSLDINTTIDDDIKNLEFNQTAYLPFYSDLKNREYATLYRTDGTVDKTEQLYEMYSYNDGEFEYPIFKNFTIFGEYIYFDFVEEKFSLNSARIGQLRTNIQSGDTEISEEIEVSENNYPRINRLDINDTLYIKTVNSNLHSTLLKYNKQGEYESIELDDNDTELSNIPMVNIDKDIYMVAIKERIYKLLKLDTQSGVFSTILTDEFIEPVGVYLLGDEIYILAKNKQMQIYQLWSYNTYTKEAPHEVYTINEMPYGAVFPVDAGYVEGDNLYIITPQKSGLLLLCFNRQEKKMTTLLSASSSISDFITYNDKTIFIVDGVLWQSDGTIDGTSKLYDNNNREFLAKGLTVILDKLYFANTTSQYGEELWVYDGSSFSILDDINKGKDSSSPRYMTELNSGVVFQATNDGENNHLFYYKDGNVTVLK